MKSILVFFISCLIYVDIWAIDVQINFSSNYTFPQQILKAESVIVGSQQFVMILFSDGKIKKFTGNLVQLETIEIPNKIIVDFFLCNKTYATLMTPSIICIIQGRNQFVMVSIQNHTIQFPINKYSNLVYLSGISTYLPNNTYFIFDGLVYYSDSVARYRNTNGTQWIEFTFNFSYTTPFQPSLTLKVIQTYYNGRYYFSSYNSGRQTNIVIMQYNATNHTYFRVGQFNASSVFSNTSVDVVGFTVERMTLLMVQFSNYSFYAQTVAGWLPMNETSFAALDPLVGTSILRDIRPRTPDFGERMIIFNDKIIKVNFTNGIYTNCTIAQTFPTSLPDQYSIMQGSNSFVYFKNSNTVFRYCEKSGVSQSISACSLNVITCSSTISNCLTCSNNYTICNSCSQGYILFGNQCYLDQNCTVQNCQICSLDQTCVKCLSNITLNSTSNLCESVVTIIPVVPLFTNQTSSNSTENTTIQTNNSTIGNQTVTQNTTQTTPINQNSSLNASDQIAINQINRNKIETIFGQYHFRSQFFARMLAIINSSPIIRVFISFLTPMFLFFDDYWYYIYHENQYQNIQSMQNFLIFMYIVNSERIIPFYLQFDNPLQHKANSIIRSNYVPYTNERVLKIDQMQTYIFQNLQELLFQQYVTLIVFFLIMKIAIFMIRTVLHKKMQQNQTNHQFSHDRIKSNRMNGQKCSKSIFHHIHDYLTKKTSFKQINLAFVGSNMIFLIFQYSCQQKNTFMFNFTDTFNIIFAYWIGMSSVFCAILVLLDHEISSKFDFHSKNNSKKQTTKLKNFEDNRIENYEIFFLMLSKNILNAFIHGYFLGHTTLQYSLLILVKIWIIIVLLKVNFFPDKKCINHFVLMYSLIGILIDVLCLMSKNKCIPQMLLGYGNSEYNYVSQIQLALIISMCSLVIMMILVDSFFELRSFLRLIMINSKKSALNIRCKQTKQQFNKIVPQSFVQDMSKNVHKQTRTLFHKDGDAHKCEKNQAIITVVEGQQSQNSSQPPYVKFSIKKSEQYRNKFLIKKKEIFTRKTIKKQTSAQQTPKLSQEKKVTIKEKSKFRKNLADPLNLVFFNSLSKKENFQ